VRVPQGTLVAFDRPIIHSETKIVASDHLAFAGIYSGRMRSDIDSKADPSKPKNKKGVEDTLFEAQIGKVWYPACIGEIIASGLPLDYEEY
jgi:hypothetical protein